MSGGKRRCRDACRVQRITRVVSVVAVLCSLGVLFYITLHGNGEGDEDDSASIGSKFLLKRSARGIYARSSGLGDFFTAGLSAGRCPPGDAEVDQGNTKMPWSSLAKDLCAIEHSADLQRTPPADAVVMVRDTSRERYFAKRDLQAWQVAYEKIDMQVQELGLSEETKLSEFTVLMCLGLAFTDKSCIRAEDQLLLKTWQRINQLYGMRMLLWRKDGFCTTMTTALHGSNVSPNFFFRCWNLPEEMKEFIEAARKEYPPNQPWIVKPMGRGEGNGIVITDSLNTVASMPLDGNIVQPFLDKPLLIDNKKWDLRTYVLVTSISPLRAYFYNEGLVRFAAMSYNSSACRAGPGNEHRCLTNTSINKRFAHISQLTWTYRKLRRHLEEHGMSSQALFRSVRRAITKVLLTAEYDFRLLFNEVKPNYKCSSCFQLLGVDVILDEKLNPYVIEVRFLTEFARDLCAGLGSLQSGSAFTHFPGSLPLAWIQLGYL